MISLCVYTYIYIYIIAHMSQRDGKVMMIDQDVTKGMGTEHNVNGVE